MIKMGKKEKYQKELDFILEKIRFWRYILFAIFSGAIGVLFSLSQGKIIVNYLLVIIFFVSFIITIIAIVRVSDLTKQYFYYLNLLEKEE